MAFSHFVTIATLAAMPIFAQTTKATQKKAQPTVKAEPVPAESPEHAFAQKSYESVKQQYLDSKKDYDERIQGNSGCQPFAVDHPVSIDSVKEHMVGCSYETVRARYVMERVGEALADYDFRLQHVDACLKVYAATIDKKLSDQTQREIDLIKLCKSGELYPPPTKAK